MANIRTSAWCFPNYFLISDKYLDEESNVNIVISSEIQLVKYPRAVSKYPKLSEERRPERVLEVLDCNRQRRDDSSRVDKRKMKIPRRYLAHIVNVVSCVMLTLMTLQIVKSQDILNL